MWSNKDQIYSLTWNSSSKNKVKETMVFQDTGQRQPKTSVPERQDRNEVSPNGLCLVSGGLPWQRPGGKLRRAQNDKGSYSPQAWEPRREPYTEGPQSSGGFFWGIQQHLPVCEGDGYRGLGKVILRHQRKREQHTPGWEWGLFPLNRMKTSWFPG